MLRVLFYYYCKVEKSKTDPKVLRSLELLLTAFEASLEKDEIKFKDSLVSKEKTV
jgi:hypothetical protein